MEATRLSAPLPLTGAEGVGKRPEMTSGCTREARAGQVVVREGEAAGGLWIVEKGALGVSVTSATGGRTILSVLGPGDVLADAALFRDALPGDGDGAEASRSTRRIPAQTGLEITEELRPEARAMVSSRLFFAPPGPLLWTLRRQPEVAIWLAARLHASVSRLEHRLATVSSLPVPGRLLALLRHLSASHGRPAVGGTRVNLPLSQETLASMVGATRESVNRAVVALASQGVIRRTGRYYVVA